MIGNSPSSTSTPHFASGFNAVYVPHPRTWTLEHEPVPESHPKLVRLVRIEELRDYF